MLPSETKTIGIAVGADEVFDFLADLRNWPHWTKLASPAVEREAVDRWVVQTSRGPARVTLRAERRWGILDHEWAEASRTWAVAMRVIANGQGSVVILTYFRPAGVSDESFERAGKNVESELERLRHVLEGIGPGQGKVA